MIGTTLSHYNILKKLGAGGMGEVYRVEDTKLDRQVAIKVLPDVFEGDPERLARFEREAKLLASLNHPNIAAIYGLDQGDGKRFLVLELVEGETLAQRVARGPLPVDEALDICRQIAEGLEAAHEKGVIHRDLKPANVKITPEGKVKVLDFGLAKAFHQEAAAADITQSPTISEAATRAGVILGTAAYMSPEQAKGKPVDKRTDIWALGCVLYEALTGKRTFRGDSVTEVMARILEAEPDWKLLHTSIPGVILLLMRWCLQKDPRERLHDIGDARSQITQAIKEPTPIESGSPAAASRIPWRTAAPVALGFLAISLAVGGFFYWRQEPDYEPRQVVRFPVVLSSDQRVTSFNQNLVALSTDGTSLIYAANNQLYLRSMNDAGNLSIQGTAGSGTYPRCPFLSPDGKWVGFWADQKLFKIPITGGSPVPLCPCPSYPWGVKWDEDGRIIFARGTDGIWQVPAAGGEPKVLIAADGSNGEAFSAPDVLPDRDWLLFTRGTVSGGYRDAQIMVQSLATGKRRQVIAGGTDGHYVPSGHLVFLRQGRLMALPFDLNRLAVSGDPVAVGDKVESGSPGTAQFSVSRNGTLAYFSPSSFGGRTLVWVKSDGTTTPAISEVLLIRLPQRTTTSGVRGC